jgi:nitroreductase
MWDFFETVRHRHSVRQYQTERAIERNKLHAILESACAAPSAGDLQSYRIFVVTDAKHRQQLSAASGHQAFIASAPVSLVFVAEGARAQSRYGARGASLFAVQDATIAASYAQLAAVAAGLGSTWVGDFDEAAVRQVLGIAADLLPVAILAMGYAAQIPEPTPRRRLDDIVTHLED